MYDEAKPLPTAASIDQFNDFDDATLVSYDNQTLLGAPGQVIQMDLSMNNLNDGAN